MLTLELKRWMKMNEKELNGEVKINFVGADG